MFKKKFLQLFILTIITGCSSAPKETISKIKFVPDIEGYKFVGITKIEDYLEQNNYQNKFIVASPDHIKFSEFNNFFQLGILAAKNQLKITNEVEFINKDRMSKLTFAGHKKISRIERKSAIIAFSAEEVYAIAELVRRQKGGAAIVMGSLSPKTRNAQVSLYPIR